MVWLTLILFLPWFAVLGGLYWLFPRQPRPRGRRLFDAAVLALSLLLSIAAMFWGFAQGAADTHAGPIWRHVLAVLYAYGAFLAVLCVAITVRSRLIPGWARQAG
jgi:hypothetical protein